MKQERVPIVVYADFECILRPVADENNTKTHKTHKHEPFSVGYYVYCYSHPVLSGYHSYRGPSPANWFAARLGELADTLKHLYNNQKPLDLSPEETRKFHTQRACHICGKDFVFTDIRVRDHNHLTGKVFILEMIC